MSKFFLLPKLVTAVVICLALYCCHKGPSSVSGTGEFIHYTVNGTLYNFDMPADSVFVDSLSESMSFTNGGNIFGNRIPVSSNDAIRIIYNKASISQGSLQTLVSFYTPQTGFYPQFTTASAPVMITVTEYGAVNQYIAGNFAATLVGPAPTNTIYNISCSFRVRRRL